MTLTPRASGELIASLAAHVKINEEGIAKLGDVITEEVNSERLSVKNFSQNDFHPRPEDPWALEWLFVVDTLNSCFWHTENKKSWAVEGKRGYFALCTAINRALRENVDILNPHFYSTITKDQLSNVLRSDTKTKIPLLHQRVECLHEVGTCLLEKFNGSFETCVKQANHSAPELLNIITTNFKCFQDKAEYKNHSVSFNKRAQILVGDIWSCFRNEGIGYFKDIEEITMFPDYRVPQSLLLFDALQYDELLLKQLQAETILEYGGEMEIEIRGCSIHAVSLLTKYIKQRIKPGRIINDILVDHFLWDFRRKHAKEIYSKKIPFHKTVCIYY